MKSLLPLLLFLASVPAFAQSVVLTWAAPTEYGNNSLIPTSTGITYNVYGAAQGQPMTLLASGIVGTTTTRTNVAVGVHCYAVTAVINGVESPQSTPPVCATVALTPMAPTGVAAVVKP